MIALSILQPYAWLIVNGHKDIENRSWQTTQHGEFLVHAGRRYSRTDHDQSAIILRGVHGIELPAFEAMPVGGIVGHAQIIGCVRDHPSAWKQPGSWGFVLQGAAPLPFTPWRGQLGWFNVDAEKIKDAFSSDQAGGLF